MKDHHYDQLYASGGFGYKQCNHRKKLQGLCRELGLTGKVLDAPCGDGFWGKLLRRIGCQVTFADLSSVGCSKCNGIAWDLEKLNEQWIGQFDWVFSRAISHLHHESLASVPLVFDNLVQYAPKVLVIYWTDQSRRNMNGRHFCHTKESLDQCFRRYNLLESFMQKNLYHAVISARPN